jgi:hypothetical protein
MRAHLIVQIFLRESAIIQICQLVQFALRPGINGGRLAHDRPSGDFGCIKVFRRAGEARKIEAHRGALLGFGINAHPAARLAVADQS